MHTHAHSLTTGSIRAVCHTHARTVVYITHTHGYVRVVYVYGCWFTLPRTRAFTHRLTGWTTFDLQFTRGLPGWITGRLRVYSCTVALPSCTATFAVGYGLQLPLQLDYYPRCHGYARGCHVYRLHRWFTAVAVVVTVYHYTTHTHLRLPDVGLRGFARCPLRLPLHCRGYVAVAAAFSSPLYGCLHVTGWLRTRFTLHTVRLHTDISQLHTRGWITAVAVAFALRFALVTRALLVHGCRVDLLHTRTHYPVGRGSYVYALVTGYHTPRLHLFTRFGYRI